LEDLGDTVRPALLPESIFLLTRLGELSPEQGTEEKEVSTEGTDRCRPPALDPNKGDVLMRLNCPLAPELLRAWILEMT
jgi:hypothetical protein